MIRVYIVDDHAVVIEGICSLLQNEEGIEVVGHATNAAHCLEYFASQKADIILMDIGLPDMNGTDLCTQLRTTCPGLVVLALSNFNQGTYVRKMMEGGASGYLLKNASREEIIEAIRITAQGGTYFNADAEQALRSITEQRDQLPTLTKREKEIMALIAEGLTNNQIAAKLFISIDTVDSHRKNLYTKLGVKNTAMLIRWAMENQLL
jgi:DNA-binding NarL/FixJ family response regulator